MPDQALSGIKVLDVGHYIAGPYRTKLFADFGAQVVKVEKPIVYNKVYIASVKCGGGSSCVPKEVCHTSS